MNAFKTKLLRPAALIMVGLLALVGCGSDSSDDPVVDSTKSKAGYSIIEPIQYRFQNQENGVLELKTSESRIWYSYWPADTDVAKKPLFVMINGGPGSSTSTQLFSMNTAPYTLDREHFKPNSDGYSLNDYSWTWMGNLLYIDAAAPCDSVVPELLESYPKHDSRCHIPVAERAQLFAEQIAPRL